MSKKTPLCEIHKKMGARLVDFAGWEMPVQYSGIKQEHMAVRQKAGIFDVSHMGEIEISGKGAMDLVQKVTCNNAAKLVPGRSQYSALLNEQGTFIDDVIVYRMADEKFLICVNASNIEKDFSWIQFHASRQAKVANQSNEWGLIALQGPLSKKIVPSDLKKTRFSKTTLAGVDVILSSTGYTGEEGYEIFTPALKTETVWNHLLEVGSPMGLLPCGLASRDTLRLEAGYSLYGHEIDDKTTPYEAGLQWIVKQEKGEFMGSQALTNATTPKKRLVGLELEEAGVPREGYKIIDGEKEIGWVTSGTMSPLLNKGIAMGYVTCDLTKESLVGKKIQIEIRGKGKTAKMVPLPFYKKK